MIKKIAGIISISLAVISLPLCFDSLGILVALLALLAATISALLININHSAIAALVATVAIFGVSPLPQILEQTESVGISIETSSYNPEWAHPSMPARTEIYFQKRMGDQQEIAARNKTLLTIIGSIYFLYVAAISYALLKGVTHK